MNDHLNPKEVVSAAPDAIALASGAVLTRPHPLAKGLTLREIAECCALVKYPARERELNAGASVMSLGMTTEDFTAVISTGLEPITVAAYQLQAEHLAFSVPQEVRNFNPTPIPAVDMDVNLLPLVNDQMELEEFKGVLSNGAREVRIARFGRALTLTRVAVVNNQLLDFSRRFTEAGANTARLESRLVAAALEENPQLDDDQVVFGAEFLNLLEGTEGVFSSTALGKAMGMLRKQRTQSGEFSDYAAKHLVVEPELEFAARTTLRDLAIEMKVSVLAGLPAGRWYVLADPLLAPVIGILRLLGAKNPVRVGKPYKPIEVDGTSIGIVADLGACMLRRTGIVRGGPST